MADFHFWVLRLREEKPTCKNTKYQTQTITLLDKNTKNILVMSGSARGLREGKPTCKSEGWEIRKQKYSHTLADNLELLNILLTCNNTEVSG